MTYYGYTDLGKTISALLFSGALFVGVMCGLDYLAKEEHRTFLLEMRDDYNARTLIEREQELRECNAILMDSWRGKNTIPGLEGVLDYFRQKI